VATELATLAGGCFWCLEAAFEMLGGVEKVESGYSGGQTPNPNYEQVCSGSTGHAEVVQVTFDPAIITYRDLLQVFFTIHDPTTLNRQGADSGPQYRSAIYFHSPDQEAAARETIAELDRGKVWDSPIITEVTRFDQFYPAEKYHREYYRRNPRQMYCQVVIAPKVAKLRAEHFGRLKAGV
jgi:peptide-methionine (S)-S-oxide reductase